jgi:hypothetical protein
MKDIPLMGTVNDQRRRFTTAREDDHVRRFKVQLARKFIYCEGRPVNGKAVNDVLFSTSAVPTTVCPKLNLGCMHVSIHLSQNAFSDRLGSLPGFHLYRMLVPDLMHEFELGVWKSVFIHLLRMLNCEGEDVVSEFNTR